MKPPTFDKLSVWFNQLAEDERVKLEDRERKSSPTSANIDVTLDRNWLQSLRIAYEEDTKRVIKDQTRNGQCSRLDRHKVAAAMTLATLRISPFSIRGSSIGQQTSRCRESNVFLGIEIGCIVVLLFGTTEANLTENKELAEIYRDFDDTSFVAIPTGNGDGTYIDQLVKAINFARRDSGPTPNGYSLLLAHIFFLLQSSFERRRCHELSIDPDCLSLNLSERMKRIDELEKST